MSIRSINVCGTIGMFVNGKISCQHIVMAASMGSDINFFDKISFVKTTACPSVTKTVNETGPPRVHSFLWWLALAGLISTLTIQLIGARCLNEILINVNSLSTVHASIVDNVINCQGE